MFKLLQSLDFIDIKTIHKKIGRTCQVFNKRLQVLNTYQKHSTDFLYDRFFESNLNFFTEHLKIYENSRFF